MGRLEISLTMLTIPRLIIGRLLFRRPTGDFFLGQVDTRWLPSLGVLLIVTHTEEVVQYI